MTDFLDLADLLRIAARIQGKTPPEVRDYGLLESAAARPQASVFGDDAYPDLHHKAAALLHSLARNHPLVDGNKRLAWVAMRVMYRLNRGDVRPPDVDTAEEFVLQVARGELEVPDIAKTLAMWSG
ncbi:death-on-curing protein [Stackebrandtia albiflava]|uniref:Death-on-curing protein n=1 Tax=Stackebrandtia albiflava TaxID=406432 RepID=A0A562V370_9ACTN|nr:type II toxin-antitoxin system death-on-curing family toxin [Stackebrandtia albiflava]TWJ12340.1 death-on-curing protein [Stackebrandtia albiflava]